MRRVVITGLGAVTPLGVGVDHVWDRLINGQSGITAISDFEVSDLPCRIAGTIPKGPKAEGGFDINEHVDSKEQRKMDQFIAYSIAAADEALEDAGWSPEDEEDQNMTGVMIGSGIGGLNGIAVGGKLVEERGPRRLSPFFIPSNLINLASGFVSIKHQFRGPNHGTRQSD